MASPTKSHSPPAAAAGNTRRAADTRVSHTAKSTAPTKSGTTAETPIDLTAASPARPAAKRKAQGDLRRPTQAPNVPAIPSSANKRRRGAGQGGSSPVEEEEERLRRFRASPPYSFDAVYRRAQSQRFYVLKRQRGGAAECPEETFELAGTTGNVYTVRVDKVPRCDCPHALAGNQCKHVIYILSRVLHAPYDLVYQQALLSSELRLIFASAPCKSSPASSSSSSSKRKPIEGECSICFSELLPQGEAVVWCEASCGQNIHKECFDLWARTKSVARLTCPLCRAAWKDDNRSAAAAAAAAAVVVSKEKGRVTGEGYVNVADQLGISGHRDTSSYWQWYNWPPSRRNRTWAARSLERDARLDDE